MKSLGDVVAEPPKTNNSSNNNRAASNGIDAKSSSNNGVGGGSDYCMQLSSSSRRGSLDSVDRLSLSSGSTSTSVGASEIGTRTLKSLKRGLGKLWRRHRGNVSITEYDPTYKVAYLGNVLTGWAKGTIQIVSSKRSFSDGSEADSVSHTTLYVLTFLSFIKSQVSIVATRAARDDSCTHATGRGSQLILLKLQPRRKATFYIYIQMCTRGGGSSARVHDTNVNVISSCATARCLEIRSNRIYRREHRCVRVSKKVYPEASNKHRKIGGIIGKLRERLEFHLRADFPRELFPMVYNTCELCIYKQQRQQQRVESPHAYNMRMAIKRLDKTCARAPVCACEGCVEKPVSTLWRNYVGSNRPDVLMRLTVTNGGLTATTKDHGLTEYWAHRVTYCTAPASHPRLFVWVYRHEGRRLRPELRCHAAICSKESTARRLAQILNARLHQALLEFRRDKVSRQNARLSLANAVYENPSLPRRKLLLSTGGSNYRPPLERSKSAPKLSAIEEDAAAEEQEGRAFLDQLRQGLEFRRSCSWQHEQESWRLARLLEALQMQHQHADQLSSSDENGSISSGCETASTANSEERVSSSEDSHIPIEEDSHLRMKKQSPGSALTAAMTVSPRRNSEGSPGFMMSCNDSPRFRRRNCRVSRVRSRSSSNYSLSRNEPAEDDEEEEEEEEMSQDETTVSTTTMTTVGTTTTTTGVTCTTGDENYFDFEDPEVMDEIVDFSPQGEGHHPQSPSRLQNDSYAALLARRDDMLKMMTSRLSCHNSCDELDSPTAPISDHHRPNDATTIRSVAPIAAAVVGISNFHTLGSLDEEEAIDSDESGYVEASPKSSMNDEEIVKAETNNNKVVNSSSQSQSQNRQRVSSSGHDSNNDNNKPKPSSDSDDEPAEFIKCPISETIKKLANASLRSSKNMRVSSSSTSPSSNNAPHCLESLNRLGSNGKQEATVSDEPPTPSLLQRKRLLAQRGVTV
ncbi:unnamed protein product [Trichogramma brassicae]|uniref:PID domain-containing protein n=1 Tax=Trichogramma brassicae TaxID=86971 RepID=A0A6H5IX95_9HYME|nr:unnamed protein product [Trichogramma brassicae]